MKAKRILGLFVCVKLTLLLLLSSCTTRKQIEYVDRDVVRYEAKVRHDTLVRDTRDSVFFSVIQSGDTIYSTKYVEKIKFKDRVTYIRDTIYKDSILAERKETKEISANTEGIAGKWITLIIIVFLLLLPLVGITIIIIKK